MKSKIAYALVSLAFFFGLAVPVLAQNASPTTAPAAAVAAPAAPAAPADFLTQVLATIQNFGGLSTLMKVSAVILLLIASVKVSFLNQLIWSKLGIYQSLVAPVLGLIAGLVGLFGGGSPITIASVLAYLGAGVGAMGLHEVLDGIKAVPGIGPTWVSIISAIENALGGPSSKA